MKKFFTFLFAIIFIATFLTACSSNNGGEYEPQTEQTEQATPDAQPTPAPPPQPLQDFGTSDFPALHITMNGNELHRTDWLDVVFTVDSATTGYNFTDAGGRIRGRGHSSWNYMEGKMPFRIRFDEPRAMPGSSYAARDWTFIANHSDKSLLRNYSAYFFARSLDGMSYAPSAQFVDVYFDGVYQGVYMMSIQVNEIAEGRLNLVSHPVPGLSEFLLEMCSRVTAGGGVEGLTYVRLHPHISPFDIRIPHNAMQIQQYAVYIRGFLGNIDSLIRARNPAVFDYIDKASFVDFYLVQELFKNIDIEVSSVFMQIRGTGEDRRLEMGPVWDFDIAAGNAYYQDMAGHQGGYGPTGGWAMYRMWFRYLMEIPAFREAATFRWREIRDAEIRMMLDHILDIAIRYESSFERNFLRWPIMGIFVWPNPAEVVAIDTFMGQVDYLIRWLEARIAWLDTHIF